LQYYFIYQVYFFISLDVYLYKCFFISLIYDEVTFAICFLYISRVISAILFPLTFAPLTVECLPSKHEALNSNPISEKKKRKEKKTKIKLRHPKGDITTDITEFQSIVWEYFFQ
jgi:membrane-anchored protein YejM (alkaline phosphatase superfamily)